MLALIEKGVSNKMNKEIRTIKASEMRGDALVQPPFGTYAPRGKQKALLFLARITFLKRGLFRRTMTRLIMGQSGTPIDVDFRGCHFRLQGANNLIEFGILLNPRYNGEDIDFLIDGAPSGANFVDVGSNIGLYSLPMAKAASPKGRVVSIDANPLMASTLTWNANASNLSNVQVISCAVSDRDGRADLMVRKDDIAIVHVVEKSDGAVPVRTLSSLLEEHNIQSIHGLKIDIEGHEDKALVPFLSQAPKQLLPKRIVIEHPKPTEDYPGCTAVFKARGYLLKGRNQNNSLYELGV
jgi:FkbM family methyltransferase